MQENFHEITNFIWNVADLLRDVYKRKNYSDVILPFTVLKRLDSVLADTKASVLKTNEKYFGKLEDPSAVLKKTSGHEFYNRSLLDFKKLLSDPLNIKPNMLDYLHGFSANVQEVFEKFQLYDRISYLAEKDLLFQVVQKFSEIDLSPQTVSNHTMGYIFEELIRKFNEENNEEAGEHFTPREIIRLMVNVLMSKDKEKLGEKGIITTVYDPACGTGGMLTISKEYILEKINPNAEVVLFGQEINDETYAVCKSDMIIKGENPDNIKPFSSFSHDGFPNQKFDYILSNPPYGKDWGQDRQFIEDEYLNGYSGRFGPGLPRISDGQLLFLLHMISKIHASERGNRTRIAIIFNGSPLFTGDAGSGESNIRRWIIENDFLEAIIGLPDQLFYNTGINTYLWVLTNKKDEEKKGKIVLLDSRDMFIDMKKNLGQKRKEISGDQIDEITDLYLNNKMNGRLKVFENSDFGYRKIIVDRPLKMKFLITGEGTNKLRSESPYNNLSNNESLSPLTNQIIELNDVIESLTLLSGKEFISKEEFKNALLELFSEKGTRLSQMQWNSIFKLFGTRDENAAIVVGRDGKPEADKELRDYEIVPLKEDVNSYFEREVKPYIPDAWINTDIKDEKDGKVGKVGYEISFNRYFNKYVPPRSLEDIDEDIKYFATKIATLLGEITK